jgi:Ca2+-binding EF-hand superfamily protein
MKWLTLCASAAVVAAAWGCSGRPLPPPGAPNEREGNRLELVRFDVNNDGIISRAELDEGLRRDYAVIDRNGDGRLSTQEVSAENDRRWLADGPAATPLFDWNQDGTVDFAEFTNSTGGLFDQVDANHDGAVSRAELQNLMRRGPPLGEPRQARGGARRGL